MAVRATHSGSWPRSRRETRTHRARPTLHPTGRRHRHQWRCAAAPSRYGDRTVEALRIRLVGEDGNHRICRDFRHVGQAFGDVAVVDVVDVLPRNPEVSDPGPPDATTSKTSKRGPQPGQPIVGSLTSAGPAVPRENAQATFRVTTAVPRRAGATTIIAHREVAPSRPTTSEQRRSAPTAMGGAAATQSKGCRMPQSHAARPPRPTSTTHANAAGPPDVSAVRAVVIGGPHCASSFLHHVDGGHSDAGSVLATPRSALCRSLRCTEGSWRRLTGSGRPAAAHRRRGPRPRSRRRWPRRRAVS